MRIKIVDLKMMLPSLCPVKIFENPLFGGRLCYEGEAAYIDARLFNRAVIGFEPRSTAIPPHAALDVEVEGER